MPDPSIYPPGVVNPTVPPEVDNPYPPMPVLPGNRPPGSVVIQTGGTAPFLPAAMKWLAALALLWIILTALTEYSPNMRQLGIGFAGLILVGALYYLGPKAIENAKHLWE